MWYKTNKEFVQTVKHRFLPRKFYIPIKYDRETNYVNKTTGRKNYICTGVSLSP